MVSSKLLASKAEDRRSPINDDDRLLYLMDEISRSARRSYDLSVAGLGLNRTQWRIIGLLLQEPELTQAAIGKRLDLESATIGQAVMALCQRGLAEKERAPSDRRAWRISLTSEIDTILPQLRQSADRLHSILWAGFTSEEKSEMKTQLGRISNNLAQLPVAAD
ncbi:MarR family winged helix-turn-helix transcriptional regulator [Erythrobacter sp. MTPC3]|uniref:MarR family winged helix-turn-helix transcriptional regulator n=1 Tax=Erythrobacter sp. MTPC3 TaxID=3056564 RepID=UPI0036F294F9